MRRGFILQDGSDWELPVFVHNISRNRITQISALEPGYIIVRICESMWMGRIHVGVKAGVLRAGNELDLTVANGF